MKSGSFEFPSRLPLLPLRDVVLFPGITLPLFVGRSKSVRAVDHAIEESGLIITATQKRPDLTEPTGRDLHRVGVIASIREHSRLPDGTLRVVAQGLYRVRLRRLQCRDFFEGTLSALPDSDPVEPHLPVSQLRNDVLARFEEYVSLRDRLPEEIFETALTLEDPSSFSLYVAGHLTSGVSGRQRLLETEGWLTRLRMLNEMLEADVRVLRSEKRARHAASLIRAERDLAPRDRGRRAPEMSEPDDEDELEEVRKAIEKAEMPDAVRAKASHEIRRLSRMNPMSPEATVSRTYLDCLAALPWTERTPDRTDLAEAEKILDEDHYGLRKVKDRILEYISVLQLSKKIRGPVLCLLGPPGVGKTSLGRSIARALGRKFVRMSLGGIRDEAEIRGHRRTYIGSMPGRIIQAMRRGGTVNPLILLDEIDKIGSDYRGDPSAALLEVLDPEQNHSFQDHYLDVEYDLSNVMFVTTANSLSGIHPALFDRMELLRLPGYLEHEKLAIMRRYLLPRQIEECGLTETDLRVSDGAIRDLIRCRTREAGVRNLEREVAALCRKAARRRADPRTSGPLKVTRRSMNTVLGAPRFMSSEVVTRGRVGLSTGLAYTEAGGVILNIEVALLPGRGRLILTGKLGETMQESGQAALSYIRSRSALFGLETNFSDRLDIHVHVAEGAVPKDGPSAGVSMALSMISALTGTPTRVDVALTGEITLRGTVLPVGGLAEKVMAARRAGIDTVIVPLENLPQVRELPKELTSSLEIVPVRCMDEVLEYGLDGRAAIAEPALTLSSGSH